MTLVNTETGEIVADLSTLESCEAVIERGIYTFLEVGQALMAIKENGWHRAAGFQSLDDYCEQRWSIGRRQGERMVAAAMAIGELGEPDDATHGSHRDPDDSPTGESLPAWGLPRNERQARPLTRLGSATAKRKAWDAANRAAEKEGRAVTARDVEAAVLELLDPKPSKTTTRKSESTTTETAASGDGPSESDPTPDSDGHVGQDEADAINRAFENGVDPLADFRRSFFLDVDKAFRLTNVDIERAAQASDGTERAHVSAVRDWCDRYLEATKPNHLRSVR